MTDEELLTLAIAEAKVGLAEGGIPIGAALAHGDRVLGVGHNRRVQMGKKVSQILGILGLEQPLRHATRLEPDERSQRGVSLQRPANLRKGRHCRGQPDALSAKV